MPYVSVPRDLTRVKSKFLLNLTKRQCCCFGLGALTGIPTYMGTRGLIGNETAALLMVGLALPFFLFGIYEKDGQPLEKMLWYVLRAQFLYPRTRPYQTENFYAVLSDFNKGESRIEAQPAGKTGAKAAKRNKTTAGRKGGLKRNSPPHSKSKSKGAKRRH